MKIAFFHELHKGGARRGTNEFAKQLKIFGNIVDLYTIDSSIPEEKVFYTNVFYFKFKSKEWFGNNPKVRFYKDTIELLKLFFHDLKIAKIINKKKYDVVYVAASRFIESPFILNFIKSPTFFYCNDPYYRIIYEPELFKAKDIGILRIKYEQINRFVRKYLDKWNISRADYILSISKFTMNMFTKVYKRSGNVIYYGVNTKHFTPKKIFKKYDLLFIGSYDFLDGYPFFLEVISKMKIKPRIRKVIFEEEWLSDNDLLSVYRESKIFVSVSYKEPLGMVPMEIMSCGIPVVGVNEAGHKETIINNKTGYLIKRDANLFASKLDYLLTHNEVIDNMGKEARLDMVKHWDWVVKGKQLEDFFKKRIKNKK